MGIPNNCHCTVLMDCDHATSVIDVAGTLDGQLVDGLKFHNFCGLKNHTTKVQLAQHDRDVWQEESARTVKARPRFQPMMEIDNPRKGRLPTRPAMSRSTPVAFCYSAAGHGQTAIEMQMSVSVEGKEQPRHHGILTWCFISALEELRYDCSHTELKLSIEKKMSILKGKDLPMMDQQVLLTFSTPLSNPMMMKVNQPIQTGRVSSYSFSSGGGMGVERGAANPMAPPVVPPPPPGFISGQMAGAGVSGDVASGPPKSGPNPSYFAGQVGGQPQYGGEEKLPLPPPPPGGHIPPGVYGTPAPSRDIRQADAQAERGTPERIPAEDYAEDYRLSGGPQPLPRHPSSGSFPGQQYNNQGYYHPAPQQNIPFGATPSGYAGAPAVQGRGNSFGVDQAGGAIGHPPMRGLDPPNLLPQFLAAPQALRFQGSMQAGPVANMYGGQPTAQPHNSHFATR
jgi:hypothetical protein